MCSNLHDKCFKLSMSHACSLKLAWNETYTNYLFIKKKHIVITSNNNLSEKKCIFIAVIVFLFHFFFLNKFIRYISSFGSWSTKYLYVEETNTLSWLLKVLLRAMLFKETFSLAWWIYLRGWFYSEWKSEVYFDFLVFFFLVVVW